ncbi:class I SAM-dependent methyltransferase, partial [Nocardiopsis sp. MG754419]|nr:class I SAM-dependent methyltransferase [Nocardiopsis sp. MG754419]
RVLNDLKTELGLDTPIRDSAHNPMIFFRLPHRPRPAATFAPPRPRAADDDRAPRT